MTVAREDLPVPRGWGVALAAAGPVAIGGILAARAGDPSPMLAAPAIVFGVVAATGPALYIALAAAGHAPPLAAVVRAFGVALAAFGVALAGLILPVAFAAASSVSAVTATAATTAAIAGAGALGLRRLARELGARALGGAVFVVWAVATATIAGRLWWDLAVEVAS
jgi:hypothetical protein